jgi:F420-0:gamma-glutamyl ligase-like protein
MIKYTDETYTEMCNKYFAPLDEIAEALNNFEGVCGFIYTELQAVVFDNKTLQSDLLMYEGIAI